jgi:DHA1 family tetracycline resistance protein-like MFS transporter
MFKTLDRRLITILLIVLVQLIGASMILPLLPLYARRQFAIPEEVITLLVSSFFAAQFIAGPFLGRFSDIYGRLPVLIVSQAGTVLAFAMIGLAESTAVLFAARILDGITGGNIIVAQAYVTDITPPRQRTQALGYILAAFGVGFIFGPSLGGILGAAFGERAPFLVAAVAALLTLLLTWFTLDETITPEKRAANRAKDAPRFRPADIISNRALLLILLITFGAQYSFSMLQSTFALFGEDVLFAEYTASAATLRVGLLLSTIGIGQVITQVFILRRLLAHYREYLLVIGGTLIRGLATVSIVLVPNPYLAAFSLAFFAIGTGIQLPALQSLAASSAPDNVRGAVLGTYQSANSLAIIIGSAMAGTLYAISPNVPYVLGGSLLIAMMLPALLLARFHPQISEEAAA